MLSEAPENFWLNWEKLEKGNVWSKKHSQQTQILKVLEKFLQKNLVKNKNK